MSKKIFYFFPLLILVLSGCGLGQAPKAAPDPSASSGKPGISLETVAAHNTAEDCWLVVNNNIYNVTDYIASHPGGQAIVQGCGKDATEIFETRPTGSKTPHSDQAREAMAKYYIGDLKR